MNPTVLLIFGIGLQCRQVFASSAVSLPNETLISLSSHDPVAVALLPRQEGGGTGIEGGVVEAANLVIGDSVNILQSGVVALNTFINGTIGPIAGVLLGDIQKFIGNLFSGGKPSSSLGATTLNPNDYVIVVGGNQQQQPGIYPPQYPQSQQYPQYQHIQPQYPQPQIPLQVPPGAIYG